MLRRTAAALLGRSARSLPFLSRNASSIPKTERTRHFVKLDDKPNGEVFEFDEEMHIFSPPHDYGYISLQLGHRFTDIDRPYPCGDLASTDQYEIVRKLGWGNEASVWLARRHTQNNNPHPRFVAIKILTSFHSNMSIMEKKKRLEFNALAEFNKPRENHPGKAYCTLMRDAFPYFQSKHGPHLCIVLDAYSINLLQYLNEMRRRAPQDELSLTGIKKVTKQVLLALTYVHSMKLIHTDLKLDNLFIDTGARDDEIEALLLSDPSRTYPPRHEPRIHPEPIVTVESQPLPVFGTPDRDNLPFKLGDFGGVQLVNDVERDQWTMPDGLRAPEIFLECPWGTAVDIWSLGCMLWAMVFFRADRKIFHVDFPLPEGSNIMHAHLARIKELLGEVPRSLIERSPQRSAYFDDDGRLLYELPESAPSFGSLTEQLAQSTLKQKYSTDDVLQLERFMRRCLAIDPAERPTAEELLKDPWLAEVQ